MTAPLLPPHLQLVADAVETPPEGPALTEREVAAAVGSLTAALAEQGARLPAGSAVAVDMFSLLRACQCPASRTLDADAPAFSWSPQNSARWLGMKALESFVTEQCADIAGAVAAACAGLGSDREAEGRAWGPPVWLQQEATPAERAATIAVAAQWAEQAALWAPWARWRAPERRLRFDPARGHWPRRRPPVTVRARWDADLRPFRDRSRVQLLLLASLPGSADARAAVRLAALGGWLDEPRAERGPARVVAVHPAGGEVVAHTVDAALLAEAVADVAAAATTLVDAALAQPLVARPGAMCRWCPRVGRCPDGTAWLHRPERRVAGLPVG